MCCEGKGMMEEAVWREKWKEGAGLEVVVKDTESRAIQPGD